jgi:hypothetical protein
MVDRVPRILPVEMEDKVKDFASNVESLVDKVVSGVFVLSCVYVVVGGCHPDCCYCAALTMCVAALFQQCLNRACTSDSGKALVRGTCAACGGVPQCQCHVASSSCFTLFTLQARLG